MISSYRNIIRVEEVVLEHDASIRWDGVHFVVQVAAQAGPGRQRFSIAHEVTHTFFPGAHHRIGRPDRGIGRNSRRGSEEYLCDLGAAEFVLPRGPFLDRLPDRPGMAFVVETAREFGASIEATARRTLALSGRPGAVVVLEPRLKPVEVRAAIQAEVAPSLPGLQLPPPVPKLRVNWSESQFVSFIPRHKSIADDSSLSGILETGEVEFEGDTGLLPGRFRVSARHLPYSRDGERIERVVALLFRA